MRLLQRLNLRLSLWVGACAFIPLACLAIDLYDFWFRHPSETIVEARLHAVFAQKLAATAGAALLCAALAVIGIFLILRRHILPLATPVAYCLELAKGSFPPDCPAREDDEIGSLGRYLNHIRDRIQYLSVKLKTFRNMERKAWEEVDALRRQRAHFLSEISSQINAPFSHILSLSESALAAAAAGRPCDPEIRQRLEAVRSSADRMASIALGLGDLAKYQDDGVEAAVSEFVLLDLLRDLCDLHQMAAASRRIAFKSVYSANLPRRLKTDRGLLFQCLSNLLAYAISCSPEGSEVVFGCDAGAQGVQFWLKHSASGSHAKAVAKLMAASSPLDDLELLLRNAQILGVASAVCAANTIKALLSASMDEDGRGNRFSVALPSNAVVENSDSVPLPRFPAAPPSAAPAAQKARLPPNAPRMTPPRARNTDSGKLRRLGAASSAIVLVAVPEGSDRNATVEVLRDYGAPTPAFASSTDECVAAAAQTPPDLLVLDWDLPGSLSAREAVARVQEASQGRTGVVVFSHASGAHERNSILRAGAAECLVKPVSVRDLFAALSPCL